MEVKDLRFPLLNSLEDDLSQATFALLYPTVLLIICLERLSAVPLLNSLYTRFISRPSALPYYTPVLTLIFLVA